MDIQQIIALYAENQTLKQFVAEQPKVSHWKSVSGSQFSFLLSAFFQLKKTTFSLICFDDRERAFYFYDELNRINSNDLHLMFFPSSAKRPYQIEEIDNANVLRRTEVLTQISHFQQNKIDKPLVILTYPEALFDKVIDAKGLTQNSLKITKGESPGMSFLIEVLHEYQFTATFEVSEPGEYAKRGCIVDFYSYAYAHPIRFTFDDDTIVSIKTFDVESQLTIQELDYIHLIPNTQTIDNEQKRISLMEYLGKDALLWIEDKDNLLSVIEKLYEKSVSIFDEMFTRSGGGTPVSSPEQLFMTSQKWEAELNDAHIVWFGKFSKKNLKTYDFQGQAQPIFKKDFYLLSDHLANNHELRKPTYIFAEEKQLKRLKEIFRQVNPKAVFEGVPFPIYQGFEDNLLGISCFTDHQIFERYYKYKLPFQPIQNAEKSLKELSKLSPGDFVTHRDFGIAQFGGLSLVKMGDNEIEMVKLIFRGGSILYEFVSQLHKISKYSSKDGAVPSLSKLGSGEWKKTKSKVRRRVKELAFDIIQLYAKRKSSKGYAYSPDQFLMQELEASFLYEPTPDQEKAMNEVKKDLEAPYPMDRLICGDVGFGKTEVAIRAAFKVACDGKQTAVLVPTTILALQHYKTFCERFEKFPVRVDYLNRFKSTKEIKETLKKLEEGKIDIIIGTHRLLSEDVKFKDLGLLIIDEEQRFGVAAKEKLRLKKINVDTLTLTATPIPRTLQFSLMGVRDMSVIQTPPPNRQPIETILHRFGKEVIRDAISYEIFRGGQVFFVHNRIAELESIAAMIKELVPEAKIALIHGQMKEEQVEKTMSGFINLTYNVLVSTTIIESGIDIPNANTIIINEAQNYGLSDLHQMRGRVGRSNKKAFCYLLAPPLNVLPSDSMKRLQAIEEFSDLGSGFQISLKDMDIRGAGDILGKEQSGFISEIGFDTYHQILEEIIFELKEEHFSEIFQEDIQKRKEKGTGDVQIDGDESALIPDDFIPNPAERLNFYRRISDCRNEEELRTLAAELVDRFGIIPLQTLSLFDAVRLRWLSNQLGFEKVVLRMNRMKAYFPSDSSLHYFDSDVFQSIIAFLPHQMDFVMKQQDGKVWLESNQIKTYKQAWFKLSQIWKFAEKQISKVVEQ